MWPGVQQCDNVRSPSSAHDTVMNGRSYAGWPGMSHRYRARTVIMRIVIVVGALCMAACATSSSSSAARNSCVAQFNKWRAGGGQAAFLAVGRAVGRYGRAASVLGSSGVSAATVSQLRLAAADLLTAVHSAQADPPPACVPGLRSTSGMALADFARAARGRDRCTCRAGQRCSGCGQGHPGIYHRARRGSAGN